MKIEVISDFDGTVTDIKDTGEIYIEDFSNRLLNHLGIPQSEWSKAYAHALKEIESQPGLYGWEINGNIVAPAYADPFTQNTAVAQMALETIGKVVPHEILSDIHREVYATLDTQFQEGAEKYLLDLHKNTNLTVVTNSQAQKVESKIQELLGNNEIRVIGNAYKHEVDDTWDAVPVSHQPDGFARPVFLRRKKYGEILSKFTNSPIVIGDIYELDLALPEHMGFQTVLFSSTNRCEDQYYKNHKNGFISPSLGEITEKVLSKTL